MTSIDLFAVTLFRFFFGKVDLELLPFIAECVTNIENKTNLTPLVWHGAIKSRTNVTAANVKVFILFRKCSGVNVKCILLLQNIFPKHIRYLLQNSQTSEEHGLQESSFDESVVWRL